MRAGVHPHIEFIFFNTQDPMAAERIKRFVADHSNVKRPNIAMYRPCPGVSLPLVGEPSRFSV